MCSSHFVAARAARALPLLRLALLEAALLGACSGGGSETSGPTPAFPADYAASYVEVRDCRSSTEHEFSRVRVLTDPLATEPYQGRLTDFPVGSVVLKEEHDFADTDCTGTPIRWTLMKRLEPGTSPETLDWYWQDVTASRRVETENEPRCAGCHTGCGVPPEGYQGTCAVVGATGGAFP